MQKRDLLYISLGSILIYIVLLFITYLLPENFVLLCGEFQYSLDYPGLIKEIQKNIDFSNPANLFGCPGCDLIFPYSWYFSLRYFQYLSISDLIGINPFLYFVVSGVIIQLVAVYVFFRFGLNYKKISKINLLLTSSLLILPVYKATLLCSGTSYAINHSMVLLDIAFVLFVINKTSTLKRYKLLLIGGLANILAYITIALAINYVPIIFYAVIIICAVKIKAIIRNFKSISIIVFTFAITFFITNYQWLINLSGFSNQKFFSAPANNEFFLDALTGRYFIDDIGFRILSPLFLIFLLITIIALVNINLSYKKILIFTYALLIILLMGNRFQPDIYGLLFYNFPLMNTIRSSHRLYVFIFIIQMIFTYNVMEHLRLNSIIRYGIYRLLLILICIILIINSYLVLQSQVQKVIVPDDYNNAKKYIEENYPNSKILYLPYYTGTLTNQFTWSYSTKPRLNNFVYQNPFLSIYYLPNQLSIFDWYNYPPNEFHLDRLNNLYLSKHTKNDIPSENNLDILEIDIIIVDKYSDALKKLSVINQDSIIKLAEFGEIEIYKRKEYSCIPYYGNILNERGYCFSHTVPQHLYKKTKLEFLFETKFNKVGKTLKINKDTNIISYNVSSPIVRNYFTSNRIIFGYNTIEIHNKEPEVLYNFATIEPQKDRDYLLFESIRIPDINEVPQTIVLVGKRFTKQQIISETEKTTLYVIPLKQFGDSTITIASASRYNLLVNPRIYSKQEFQELQAVADTMKIDYLD